MWKKFFPVLKKNKTAFWLIIIGSISWSLTMVKSGFVGKYGAGFWGPNGHDGVWHIALSESLAKGSWQMPTFAGETIKNYHIGFDLLLAALHKLTFIPTSILYFQILPPILALLIGICCYLFVFEWTNSKTQAFWATFFVYFGGGFGYLVTLVGSGKLEGESLFWSQASISTLVNPPFALSLIFMSLGLYFLTYSLNHASVKYLLLVTFLFGLLVQIKIYAGLLILGGLFIAGIFQLFRDRKFLILKVFVGSLVISILIFNPGSQHVGSQIIFKPFWFLEQMLITPDHLNWQRFGEALINYKLSGNLIKGLPAYMVAFIIFIAGNFGTRIISLIWFFKKGAKIEEYKYIDVFVAVIFVAGILIPTFFIQSGNSWNSIQFMYFSLVFSGILSGIIFGSWLEKGKSPRQINYGHIGIAILILFTVPTTTGTLINNYLPSRPPAKISNEELTALNFLKFKEDGVVLSDLFNIQKSQAAVSNPPRSLYLYESTAYVPAYSNKTTYLSDEVNLDITNYDWEVRKNEVERFFYTMGTVERREFLRRNNITYIYLAKPLSENYQNIIFPEPKIFENNEIVIYQTSL